MTEMMAKSAPLHPMPNLHRELREKMDDGSLVRRSEAEAAAMSYFERIAIQTGGC